MLRAVLPPLITAYAVFIAMVVLSLKRPIARPHGLGEGSARVRLRRVVRTTVGGYVAFFVIVLIFHVWLADEPEAFASAVWGGAFLSGITMVVASGSSLLGRRSRRRWWPGSGRAKEGQVVVDPRRAFGSPVLVGTGIRTEDVFLRFSAGEPILEIADDYGLTFEQTEAALRAEARFLEAQAA